MFQTMNRKIFIVAEIGQAHEGSLGIAHSYIDALAETGVDAVKFQMHIAHAESSEFEPFRIKFSYEDETRYDYWKRMEFTPEQWKGIKTHCDEKGLEFLCSPFSNAAVDLLEQLGVKQYKIGSGEVSNYLMLEKIARTGKPILLSSGMSSMKELDNVIDFLNQYGNNISILQCTTAYPTIPGQWGINFLPELKKRYNLPVGFSDHSGKIHPCIAAVAMGAELLEFHVIFDRQMFGPDAIASLTIEETKFLVNAVRELEMDNAIFQSKEPNETTIKHKNIFEKSLAINRDMKAGEEIMLSDLEAKKPKGYGIDAKDYKNVVGKRIQRDLIAFSFLNINDIL